MCPMCWHAQFSTHCMQLNSCLVAVRFFKYLAYWFARRQTFGKVSLWWQLEVRSHRWKRQFCKCHRIRMLAEHSENAPANHPATEEFISSIRSFVLCVMSPYPYISPYLNLSFGVYTRRGSDNQCSTVYPLTKHTHMYMYIHTYVHTYRISLYKCLGINPLSAAAD